MTQRGRELSELLRDPAGAYRCDLVIALTHARYVEGNIHPTLYVYIYLRTFPGCRMYVGLLPEVSP